MRIRERTQFWTRESVRGEYHKSSSIYTLLAKAQRLDTPAKSKSEIEFNEHATKTGYAYHKSAYQLCDKQRVMHYC